MFTLKSEKYLFLRIYHHTALNLYQQLPDLTILLNFRNRYVSQHIYAISDRFLSSPSTNNSTKLVKLYIILIVPT